jgi:hypothetical protein
LIASLNEGEAREKGETADGGTVDSAGEELEVGGEADMRGRPGSERREGGERWWAGAAKLGRAVWMGWREEGKRKKEKERWAGPWVELVR